MQFTHSQVAANFRGSKEDPPPATKRPCTFQSVGCMAGLGPSDERLACCAWRHRSIEKMFCYNCCLFQGAVVVSLSKWVDHMMCGSLNALRFPIKMDARVENVPRADCFAVVFDFSFWHIFFTFRFSCWWVEHSQYLFDECSDLCIGRQRERPQQSYGLRMLILQHFCYLALLSIHFETCRR